MTDMILGLTIPQFFILTAALSFTFGRMVAVMVEWNGKG